MKIYNFCSLSWSCALTQQTSVWFQMQKSLKSIERQKQLVRFGYADNKPNGLGEKMASDAKLICVPWFHDFDNLLKSSSPKTDAVTVCHFVRISSWCQSKPLASGWGTSSYDKIVSIWWAGYGSKLSFHILPTERKPAPSMNNLLPAWKVWRSSGN